MTAGLILLTVAAVAGVAVLALTYRHRPPPWRGRYRHHPHHRKDTRP